MKHQLGSQDIIIAQYGSQGGILPTITASINVIYHHERPVWVATEIRDNNFAIGSFNRSDDATTKAAHLQR